MNEPLWLDRSDCLNAHAIVLARHGGLAGLRAENMMESALTKPRQQFASGRPTLTDLGAAYAAGIVLNHPFLDGNKRAGFLLAVAFLELNGLAFIADEVDAVVQTLALAAGELGEAGYAAWLKSNSKPRAVRPRTAKPKAKTAAKRKRKR